MKNPTTYILRTALLAFVTFLPHAIIADEILLELTAEQENLSLGETTELTVTVKGVQSPPTPTFENLGTFSVQPSGQSSQVSIINGQMSASTSYSFLLSPPEQGGVFVIGPASVQVGGSVYRSNTLRLKVSQGGAAQGAPKAGGEPVGEEAQPIFVDAQVDKANPYVHEQVIYTFRFYNRAEVTQAEFAPSEFTGFWKEDLGKQQKYTDTINGQRYSVTQIRFALFANSPGKVVIDPCQLQVDVVVRTKGRRSGIDSFFDEGFFGMSRTKRLALKTKPIELEVRPLPAPPAGFSATPLVGKFSLKSEVTPRTLKVGDPATLTLTLSAHGNIWDALLPAQDFPNFRSYPDKPTLTTSSEGDEIIGTRVFKYALVPQTSGKITIPGQRVVYFDPQSERYELAVSEPVELEVNAGESDKVTHVSASATDPTKTQIKVVGSDLMPIKRGSRAISQDGLQAQEMLAIGIVFALGPFAYLAAWLAHRRRNLIQQDEGFFRRKKALARLKKQVAALDSSGNYAHDFSFALRRYLADRCDLDGAAITGADAERLLAPKGIPESMIEEVKQLLYAMDASLYGGKSLDQDDKVALGKRLITLCTQIERHVDAH